ncbi:MAG TPA: hypothetical protein VMV53_08380 [Acidimicrobiales bacterium]|nr:hypothetical protein [Acidimicrobiales bacterium]
MPGESIVIEERLATRNLAVILTAGFVAGTVRRGKRLRQRRGEGFARALSALLVVYTVVFAALMALISCIVVRVVEAPNGRRLEILYGPNGLVRQSFESDEIVAAHETTAPIVRMGGFGYRGSLKVLRRAALITRRGDALAVELTGDRRFVVTVDEAQAFATALRPQ